MGYVWIKKGVLKLMPTPADKREFLNQGEDVPEGKGGVSPETIKNCLAWGFMVTKEQYEEAKKAPGVAAVASQAIKVQTKKRVK